MLNKNRENVSISIQKKTISIKELTNYHEKNYSNYCLLVCAKKGNIINMLIIAYNNSS